MKRKSFFLIVIMMLTCLFFACAKKGVAENGSENNAAEDAGLLILDQDGNYTPKEGDRYIGVVFRFEGERDNSLELFAVCAGDTVVDCGKNCHLEDPFDKNVYVGLKYIDAFEKYYHDYEKQFEGMKKQKLDVSVLEGVDDRSMYEKEFRELAKKLGFDEEIGFCPDEKSRFIEIISQSTKDQVKLMEEDALRAGEEKEKAQKIEEDPFTPVTVSSASDYEAAYKKGKRAFLLENDLTLDVGRCMFDNADIDCQGHAIKLIGNLMPGEPDSRHNILNASKADLSGLVIDAGFFTDDDWAGNSYGMEFYNTAVENIILPESIRERMEVSNTPPFLGYVCYESAEPQRLWIGYCGPREKYSETYNREVKVVKEILSTGDGAALVDNPEQRDFQVWTDIDLDMGNAILPDSDYMNLRLMPGAKLKITGTITVTGGRLDWSVSEADQLDINDLTLIKKHPSPDMLIIRFDSSVGINDSTLKPKAGNGKISYSKGTDSYSVTIW